jgi:dienelactone hydrolase
VVHYQYGALPPAPRNVQAEVIRTARLAALDATQTTLRLAMGPGHAVSTTLILALPPGAGPFPVIVRGDLGWHRTKPQIVAAVVSRGYALADFDRTAIAQDSPVADRVYDAYPDFEGGRIAAWAWGFQRAIDWLLTQETIDAARIAVTGHSRGGKAALLAGAIDERIALTAPNNSGCGGAGCYRLQGEGSEDIAAITKTFPYWFHARFRDFTNKVNRLPFDQHTVKALVAPRALFTTEALGDLWANPQGTQQSHAAAREVFRFLGAEGQIGIRFRAGPHKHRLDDWKALLDFADWRFFGKSPFDEVAFPGAQRGYAWRAPRR